MAAVRRKRLSEEQMETKLAEFDLFAFQFDEDCRKQATRMTSRLAAKHELSVYDAAYLELSVRRQFPLGSLDRRLLKAGDEEGLPRLG